MGRHHSFRSRVCSRGKPTDKPMTKLYITYENIDDLIPAERNARTHPKKQIKRLSRSIKELGFRVPVLVAAGNRIIAGHGRVEAAKLAGLTQVPVIRVEDLSPEQLRLLAIAENKLSQSGGLDLNVLSLELKDLELLNLGVDLTLTAFDSGEIDFVLSQEDDELASDEGPSLPISRSRPAVSRSGDLWFIGDHRLLCGSALDGACYQALLWSERAQMVFTDPPYNVPISGHVSGKGAITHPEFAMASGEMSPDEFIAFLRAFITLLATWSIDGSMHFVCMDHRHIGELLKAAEGSYEYKNLCVWTKRNAGLGSLYRSQHELIGVFKSDG